MTIREEIHSLAQEISRSYEARTEGVAQIRNETRTQLGVFHSAHQAMSRKLRADLSKGHTGLITSVHAQLQELATEHAGAREEWQKMATTMQAKRAGATAVAEASPRVIPTPGKKSKGA